MKALALFFYAGRHGGERARFPAKLDRTVVSGSEYIRLDDWADGAGFNMKWWKKEGNTSLNSPSAKLVLTVDSRRAEICGVECLAVSCPWSIAIGVALISLVDAGTDD